MRSLSFVSGAPLSCVRSGACAACETIKLYNSVLLAFRLWNGPICLARHRWRLVCVGHIDSLARRGNVSASETACGVRCVRSPCWRGEACPGRTGDRLAVQQKNKFAGRTIVGKKSTSDSRVVLLSTCPTVRASIKWLKCT